jgi:hypothetical protein
MIKGEGVEKLAQSIINIPDIDKKLNGGIISLVNEIATKNEERKLVSFASKYCSFHNPSKYPIYDRFVCIALKHFNEQYSFFDLRGKDISDYTIFHDLYLAFIKELVKEDISFKQLDQYLVDIGTKKEQDKKKKI